MKFVMTQAVCGEGMELLGGKTEVYVADHGDPNDYIDEMKEADALIVRIGKCSGAVIRNSPRLKVMWGTIVWMWKRLQKEAFQLSSLPARTTGRSRNMQLQ